MNKNNSKKTAYNSVLDGKLRYAVPIAVFVLAAGFFVYGIIDGEMAAVFNKAINLCRECVGIG